jgi:hypothetical protein
MQGCAALVLRLCGKKAAAAWQAAFLMLFFEEH